MVNKTAVIIPILILLVIGLVYVADKNGYNRANSEYAIEVSKLLASAKLAQAEKQVEINNLAHIYNESLDDQREKIYEIDKLKKSLRDISDDLAHYRLFNEASNSEHLPDSIHTRPFDREADGIDAIQIAVMAYNSAAIQVNSLIDLIHSSECFIE